MKIELFRVGKKLMCRLPGDTKDTDAAELALGIMLLSKDKLKQKLGEQLPILVANCELSKKEEVDIEKLNIYLEQIYSK